ncbi:MAG: zinc-dependent metalloprotease, partial [Fimbriimonas ginsengisoli]|nr:zinc-dependent metalloprotease [Fimbriimonas ginsengisoli]
PFTGELLSASVTMDANYLAWVLSEHQDFAVPASSTSKRAFDVLLRDKDDEMPLDFRLWATDKELAVEEFERRITKTGWRRFDCRFASGLAESAAFGWNVLASIPGVKISKDDYAKQFISDTISHEVGHCLGLRHNFEASTNLTTAQLADDQLTGREGIAASVMDYTPVNVQAVLRGKGNFYMPTIGPYDVWAIQYGYTPFDAVTPQGEQYRLSKIAARSGQHGMAYMTDENVNRWDPLVVTFDCASDPLNYAGKMLVAAKRLRQYAIENLPRPGDTYEKRTELLIQSFMETMREGRIAARFVGGIHASRSLKGDPGAPPALAPISADEQRQAMKLITANCLASNAFVVPEDVALNMAFDPDVDGASQWTAPLRRIVGRWQMFMLAQVMSADTTDRITENQYKLRTRKNNYTLDEHYGLMLGAVFGDLASGKSLDPVRRDLQRFGVAALIAQAGAPFGAISEDAKTLASDALRRLSSRVGAAAKAPAADELTRVHLRETKAMIDRFLNRQIAATR